MGCARNSTTVTKLQPAVDPANCPAWTATLKIARVEDRLAELDAVLDGELTRDQRADIEALQRQLWAAKPTLMRGLEFAPARSFAGVCGLLLMMTDPVDALDVDAETPRERAAERARFARLHRLAVEALVELAGLDRKALGVAHFSYGAEGHEAVLELVSPS